MTKRSLFILLFLFIFFFNLNKVSAFVGPYSGDISSVKVLYKTDGNGQTIPGTMVINGWAVVNYNGGSSEMHNVQPTYRLRIVGYDSNNVEVINSDRQPNLVSGDTSYKPPYGAATTYAPTDLTVAYFDSGIYTSYRNGARSSNNLICDRVGHSNNSPCNYMYINIHFEFNIYLDAIKNIVQSIQKGVTVYMYLDVSTDGGTKTVYGNQLRTKAYSNSIRVGIQENRVANESYLSSLMRYGVRFGNIVQNINLIATNAKARCSTNFVERRIWKTNSRCNTAAGNLIELNGGHAGENYKVIMDNSDPDGGGFDNNFANSLPIFMYRTNIKTDGTNGGSLKTYIPSFWTRPDPNLATYLSFTPEGPALPTEITGSDAPDNRHLVCNSDLETTFNYANQKVLYSNGLCSIKCGETLNAKFLPAKLVKAGMGFDYPATFTGNRVCTFNYDDVNGWITNMNNAVTSTNTIINEIRRLQALPSRTPSESIILATDQDIYNNWLNLINTLNGQYSYCSANASSWTVNNKYDMNANVYANVGVSNEKVSYTKLASSTSSNVTNQSRGIYNVSQCVGDCTTTQKVSIDTYNWTETSTLNAIYGFTNYYYVEKYTGKATTTPTSGIDYYDIGRLYLTELNDPGGRYNFDVTLNNVGRNGINNWDKKWNIDVGCYYDVTNPDFPPNKTVGFMYRQISLTNPFPNRLAGINWRGNERLITDEGEAIYQSDPMYLVSLTPADMLEIRAYNHDNPYGDYDLDAAGRSKFIHSGDFSNLFIRK